MSELTMRSRWIVSLRKMANRGGQRATPEQYKYFLDMYQQNEEELTFGEIAKIERWLDLVKPAMTPQ